MVTKTFKEYINETVLNESFLNLFASKDLEKKKELATYIFDMLQKSYEKIGGVHGSGFKSPENMIEKIPFWKIYIKNKIPIACILYKKDKANRRKLVAACCDGTADGKKKLKQMFKDELQEYRSYGEVSDAVLHIMRKIIANNNWDENDIFVDANLAGDILGKETTVTGQKTYKREIGGREHEKVLYGRMLKNK